METSVNNKCKAFTSLEQSKKLAEILPIESADCYWEDNMTVVFGHGWHPQHIPCWSLTALLGIVSTYYSRLEITIRTDKKYNVFAMKNDFVFRSFDKFPDGIDSLINCCYEMILKLHELKML